MLTDYIQAAMKTAHYEQLDDGSFYAEFPDLQGVYANADSLEACREELRSALKDWIVFGLRNGAVLPPIQGIDLNAARIA